MPNVRSQFLSNTQLRSQILSNIPNFDFNSCQTNPASISLPTKVNFDLNPVINLNSCKLIHQIISSHSKKNKKSFNSAISKYFQNAKPEHSLIKHQFQDYNIVFLNLKLSSALIQVLAVFIVIYSN